MTSVRIIKLKTSIFVIISMIFTAMPVGANQTAIIPAYSFVSVFQSSMKAYQTYLDAQNRVAARKLIASEEVFLSPRDIKVEVVTVDDSLVKVKLNRLDQNAEPITLYFWALAKELKFLPQE